MVDLNLKNRIDGSIPGFSLARKFYKDPDIFQKEIKEIIHNSWVFAGHTSQIPNVGDYFLFKLLNESAIVVRTKEGNIRAFFNVCRHRGSHLCKEKNGNVKMFLCPYHAWSYQLDGSLAAARGMRDDFDKTINGLHKCSIEILEGMIYINFSDNPTSMDNARRDMTVALKMYDFEGLKIAATKKYEINANWKVTVENYQECYHCAPSHPEYAQGHTLKVDVDKFSELQVPMQSRMEACGILNIQTNKQFDMQEQGQEQYAYSRYALFEKFKTGSQNGEPVAPLLGNLKGYDKGCSDMNFGPLTYLLCYNDHVVIFVFTPTSHETSACDVYWLVRGDAQEGRDYGLENLIWLWDITTQADERIVMNNQKGINSKKYEPGSLSTMEVMIERFITWYLDKLHNT
ncbi:MAG: aromatic ring-hydroxylating oxygenase subunit alpha [Sphingomonadales bacterium]